MKYCVIFGSPRKNGNTAAMLSVVLEELRKTEAEICEFNAYDMDIAGCRACLGCQKNKEEICCVTDDDMQPILKAAAESDVIILAAPIYIWSAPAPVKAVIDRLVYSGCKYYGDDPHGPSLFEGKQLALICACGYPVDKAADLYEEEMKRYCKHTKMKYIGMLCERQRNLKEPFMDEEKKLRAEEFAKKLSLLF